MTHGSGGSERDAAIGVGGWIVAALGLIYLVDSASTTSARTIGGLVATCALLASFLAWRRPARRIRSEPPTGEANTDPILLWAVFVFGVMSMTVCPVLAIGFDIAASIVTAILCVSTLLLFGVTSVLIRRGIGADDEWG